MNKMLSQEEIDALLSAVPGESSANDGGSPATHEVMSYDFRHPNLVSKEQIRLLENIHESLVRNLSMYLSAQLRMIIDIELVAVEQLMYSEFMRSISVPCATYVGEIDQPFSQFVLDITPQFVVFIVERLFGGKGKFIDNPRSISIIERRIMKRIVDRIAFEISKNWRSVKEFECLFNKFESNPEFVQIVPSSEPVITITTQIKIHGEKSFINICYPYLWISSLISKTESQEKLLFGRRNISEEEHRQIAANLNATQIRVKAHLGKSNLSLRDVVNMKVGDIVQLDSRIHDQIPIYIHKCRKYEASIGERGGNYAVRIQNVLRRDEL